MSRQQFPPDVSSVSMQQISNYAESDEDFLNRQFRTSLEALERVHALSPGEFDRLVLTPASTDEERAARGRHHDDIARRALIAAQRHLLAEEEFNIWSGRRKEDGLPVKFRFERAYANVWNPLIKCKRGALTGIVRAYVRLQDELINDLIEHGVRAETARELLDTEIKAVSAGFLEFECYTAQSVDGWPCFPRSTGRFRGATRLRQFFEGRQSELPLPADVAEQFKRELADGRYTIAHNRPRATSEASVQQGTEEETPASPLQQFLGRLKRLFR